MRNIYICGNRLLGEDNGPFELLSDLQGRFPDVAFSEFDPTEEFPAEETLFIIDTVINAHEVVVITDIDSLENSPNVSVHDSDLAFNLKFLRKLGKLRNVVIFGIPVLEGLSDDDKERVKMELFSQIDVGDRADADGRDK